MVRIKHLVILGFGLLLTASTIQAQTKRIVTYIEDVQEERKSTRWTLTEWLRIKERMKMMDVWLAMFSKPQEKFAPEISLSYARGVGESEFQFQLLNPADSLESRKTNKTEDIRAQFWFTNLISGTTGLRTLAIDIGLEGGVRNRFLTDNEPMAAPSGETFSAKTDKVQQYGLNLRLFGSSSQDSMLVLKGGKFEKDAGFSRFDKITGTYWGAEMALYLLSFLGAEGNYYQYLDGKDKRGTRVDAMGFLELYNVRVGYGQARQEWDLDSDSLKLKQKEIERYLSIRLYF